jgi:hypothetical protein
VSSPTSAVILGAGNSTIEADWYVLPNIALDPNKMYLFKFRLAAQSISNPTHPAAGNDAGDYVDVQVSTDGGLTYTSEVRIRGYGNANWDYNLNGTIYETLNGVNDIYTPSGGGDRTNTGDGYSEISLEIPFGTTDLAIDLYCRVGRPGEEWWIDNIELLEIAALPVELISFSGVNDNRENRISWITASELNCSYYEVARSVDGINWDIVSTTSGMGTTNDLTEYEIIDRTYTMSTNYYKLLQYDFNGESKEYGPISIDNTTTKKEIIRITNSLGQDVDQNYRGMVYEFYSDGTKKMIYK